MITTLNIQDPVLRNTPRGVHASHGYLNTFPSSMMRLIAELLGNEPKTIARFSRVHRGFWHAQQELRLWQSLFLASFFRDVERVAYQNLVRKKLPEAPDLVWRRLYAKRFGPDFWEQSTRISQEDKNGREHKITSFLAGSKIVLGGAEGHVSVQNLDSNILAWVARNMGPDWVARNMRFASTQISEKPISHVTFANGGVAFAAGNRVFIWSDRFEVELGGFDERHTGDVTCLIALDRDGWVVSGSSDHTIRMWNVVDTEERPTIFRGHTGPVTGLLVLHDGRRFASMSEDGTVRVWDPRGGTRSTMVFTHNHSIKCFIRLTNDRLATGSDPILRVWNLNVPGQPATMFVGHRCPITSLRELANNRIASGSGSTERVLRVWNLANSNEAPTVFAGHQGEITKILALSKKEIVTASYDGTVRIWNLDYPRQHPTILERQGRVTDLQLSSDGRIVSRSADGVVRVSGISNRDLVKGSMYKLNRKALLVIMATIIGIAWYFFRWRTK